MLNIIQMSEPITPIHYRAVENMYTNNSLIVACLRSAMHKIRQKEGRPIS